MICHKNYRSLSLFANRYFLNEKLKQVRNVRKILYSQQLKFQIKSFVNIEPVQKSLQLFLRKVPEVELHELLMNGTEILSKQ